jgi:hypothetical protein
VLARDGRRLQFCGTGVVANSVGARAGCGGAGNRRCNSCDRVMRSIRLLSAYDIAF